MVALIMVAVGWWLPEPTAAQRTLAASPGDTVEITPEGRYDAGLFHRFFLGSHHRDLWRTPVKAEVVDLASFAGGLTPVGLGGGNQTRSIRFRSGDGRAFSFRSIDKDASRSLDPALRRGLAANVLQDQVSALLPMGALVVSPLLEAAGVLHANPNLVVMPSDPALGEFREDFEGLLGFIEERPNEAAVGEPGFAGADRVVGSPRFLELLEESAEHRIDGESFLQARLMDIFVGDWDRHPDQWRWAGFEEGIVTRWRPIPRDRDWALSNIGGLLPWVATYAWPHYVGFGREYPSALKSTWSGRALDRRLLSHMTRSRWEAVAADLQTRLSDAVIRDAVGRLPESYYGKIGPKLEGDLIYRRDRLPEVAGEFYDLLARKVDIHATDERDIASVTRLDGGDVTVRLTTMGPDRDADPYFERTFLSAETRQIRIYLRGNDDEAVVSGGGGSIHVRVIGGGSDDLLRDEATGGRTSFYDDRGDNDIRAGRGTRVDESEYEEPFDPEATTHQAPARDWGSSTIPIPVLEYDPDVGLFTGAGFVRWGYGFRHYPYRTRFQATIGIGTPSGEVRAALDWEFPVGPDALRGRVRGQISGAEVNRFYGLGNETSSEGPRDFFSAERQELVLESLLEWRPAPELRPGGGTHSQALSPGQRAGDVASGDRPVRAW